MTAIFFLAFVAAMLGGAVMAAVVEGRSALRIIRHEGFFAPPDEADPGVRISRRW